VLIRRGFITPLRIIPQKPDSDPSSSNRILRQYSQYRDRFLRVTFVDENLSPLTGPTIKTIIETRIHHVLNEGIIVGGRKFVFLACSNSQLGEQSAWFYCEATLSQ